MCFLQGQVSPASSSMSWRNVNMGGTVINQKYLTTELTQFEELERSLPKDGKCRRFWCRRRRRNLVTSMTPPLLLLLFLPSMHHPSVTFPGNRVEWLHSNSDRHWQHWARPFELIKFFLTLPEYQRGFQTNSQFCRVILSLRWRKIQLLCRNHNWKVIKSLPKFR